MRFKCSKVKGERLREKGGWCILLLALVFTFHLSPFTLQAQQHTRGIDVSKFQGTINWTKVASDSTIKFVYVKSTEGASLVDPYYKTNISKAKKAGLLVGYYHVYSSKTTAYKQMANIRKTVKKKDIDLVPVLDIEGYHAGKLNMERVDKLLELMEKEYGVKPMIYTSEHCYKVHFSGKKYAKYHIFIAKYKGGSPSVRHTLWQFTESGHVKGVGGDVDISKFNRHHALSDIKLPKPKKKEEKKNGKGEKEKSGKGEDEKSDEPANQ